MPARHHHRMKASVLTGPGEIRVEERDVPAVEPETVLIKVELCGICGTELLVYEGKLPIELPYYNLGHEYTGTVVEVGDRVRGAAPGDQVVINPNYHCDSCYYCRRGELGFCENRRAYKAKSNGGFAEYVLVTEKLVYHVPQGVSREAAIFAEPLSCCIHGSDLLEIKPGATVVVLGCGTMGLLTLQLCRLRGAGSIIASDPLQARRDAARALGADVTVDPRKEDLAGIVRDAAPLGPAAVIECAGAKDTVGQALELVARRGQVLLLAIWPGDEAVPVSPSRIVDKEVTLKGAVFGSLTLERALGLLGAGKIATGPLLTHTYGLDDLGEAMERARNREAIKVAVTPRDA